MNMKLSARDYIPKLRNTQVENELARRLRNESEETRVQFIDELLNSLLLPVRLAGLGLIKRVLIDKNSLLRWLERALTQVDISEVKYWLTALSPKLGDKQIRAMARHWHEEDKVSYWLH